MMHQKGMEHERKRFATMSGRQLLTRLGRISQRDKLERFIILAQEYRYDHLVAMARQKLNGKTEVAEIKYTVAEKQRVETFIIQEVELKQPRRRFDFD